MSSSWQELTRITQGSSLTIQKVGIVGKDISIEGEFELPPLARLTMEDQVFVAAFVRSHGSIKEMEKIFGVSYPTIKSRLNRISEQLAFVKVDIVTGNDAVLDRLERGEISPNEAVELLRR